MKDLITVLLVMLLVVAEAMLWFVNPMRVPASFLPARAFGIQVFQELDSSMEPTVRSARYVLVSSWVYWNDEPRIGDIVAFIYPPNPAIADLKRVVATGGSTVEIRKGVTYINEKRAPELYLRSSRSSYRASMPKVRVPPNHYFVMGDNRNQSQDSRDYGVITRERIIGRRWTWSDFVDSLMPIYKRAFNRA